jgi:hypothetical protein
MSESRSAKNRRKASLLVCRTREGLLRPSLIPLFLKMLFRVSDPASS